MYYSPRLIKSCEDRTVKLPFEKILFLGPDLDILMSNGSLIDKKYQKQGF
jgi:hypothetical protein